MADYSEIFEAAGRQHNVDPALLQAVMYRGEQSNGDPRAVSPKGATGLMQLMPDTAKEVGVADVTDPVQNIYGGAKYLAKQLDKYGSVPLALAAYNAGPGAVDKAGGIPNFPETQAYVKRTLSAYQGQNMPQTSQATRNDPLRDLIAGGGTQGPATSSKVVSSQPAAPSAPADPLRDLIANGAQGAPASSMNTGDQIPATPNTGSPSTGWKAPDSFGMGIGDAVRGGVQSLVHGIGWAANKIAPDWQVTKDFNAGIPQMDAQIGAQDKQYDAQRAAQGKTGFDAGRMAGNLVGTAPMAALTPGAGSGLLGGIASGAVSGSLGSLLTPATDANKGFAEQKAQQAGIGALTGGLANPLVKAIGGVISPAVGAAQKKLIDAGVTLTPGQALGGAWARTEEKLSSVPFLGDMIKNAQGRALQSFNKATYDEVLSPLGQKYTGPVGSDGVAQVQQTIKQAYDSALSKLTFKADPQFQGDLANLAGLAQGLPDSQRNQFMNIVKTQIVGKLGPQGTMDGEALKGIQSELGRITRGLAGDPSFDQKQLGLAVGQMKDLIESSLTRNNAPDAVQALSKANEAWANFVRLRSAAASQAAGNNGGVFTAAQLNNAVKANDKSVGKGAFATGNALMQDLSTAGQQVLGSKYPDSGTPGRALLALMGPAALGHMAAPEYVGPLAAAIGAASLPYTSLGQSLSQAALTSRPAFALPVKNALTRYGVPLAPAFGNSLVNAITRSQ